MTQFSFKMSRDLWNSLQIGDTLVDTLTRVVLVIVDIERRYDLGKRKVYKIHTRGGHTLTYSECLAYHYNKGWF